MSLAKQAQNLEGFTISVQPGQDKPNDGIELPVEGPKAEELPVEMPSAEPLDTSPAMDELYLVEEEPSEELVFVLPPLPGSTDQSDFISPEIEVDDEEEVVVEDDPWKWELSSFMEWLSKMMQGVPTHSGYDSTGLERAISYLECLDKEISKAVRMDLKNEIAIESVEKARDEIHKGLERLYERHDKVMESKYPKKKKKKKRKKKSESSDELIKEANKSTRINGITVTVPLIVSHVARICVNSMVSAGKDIEDTFDKLAQKYNFTERDKAETVQLLSDMGYAMRGRTYYGDEEFDASSVDNPDFIAQYYG